MSSWVAPELGALSERLAPYARDSFERAATLAAELHAEELSLEHWLVALLADETCAATRVVLHAFADPETIGVEVRALCAGIMVVGSERTLPFSVLGVEALQAARAGAFARPEATVTPADVLDAAFARVRPELRARLALVPHAQLASAAAPTPEHVPGAVEDSSRADEPLFRRFAPSALRALGASCRAAASLGRSAIGPAHLALGSLEADEELRARTGLTPARVRMISSGLDADETPLPERTLPGDAGLVALLRALPARAETLDVLGWLLAHGSEELTALLRRQKVTPALFERCRDVYRDPS
jgi:hypothetical protein